MAIKERKFGVKQTVAESGAINLSYYICDTQAELPSSGIEVGSFAFCLDTKNFFKADTNSSWVQLAVSGGAGEANTASNIGTAGVGIFKDKSGVDLRFKKINAGSAKVTITDDAGNNEVDVDVVDGSTAQKGAVELATDGENASGVVVQGNDSRLIQKVIKSGDETDNTGALKNAADLSFALTAGVLYKFRFQLIFQSGTGTVGLRCSVTFPAVTIFAARAQIPFASDGSDAEFIGMITSSDDAVVATAVPATNTNYIAIIEGIIKPSADGTLQCRFGSETNAGTVTLKANSIGILQKM